MLEEDNYLSGFLFLYLESFHYSGLNVPTFVENYPFGTIRSFKADDVIQILDVVWKIYHGV